MIKILTNGWGEILIKPLSRYFKNIEIIGLNKDKYYNYNDYNVFLRINNELDKDKYDIVHLNSWFDIFLFKKRDKIKYIFESHAFHPGISLKYSLLITESLINKLIILFFYPIFKMVFLLNIKKIDLYFVSIPGLIDFTKKYNAIWLPNPIDVDIFKKINSNILLDNNYINIFYPTGLRESKNPIFAFQLMNKIKFKYGNVRFYFIKQSVSNYKKYKKYLDELSENIIWLNQIKRNEMVNYYSADWDLVLGSFCQFREYAILNLIELESMACRAPVICHDLHEVILTKLDDLESLAFRIIEDKNFRKEYIEKNYNYVIEKHSSENVAKIYEKHINKLLY